MAELPSGTVTFLFTDLEGSTRRWELFPAAMREALARHDEILRDAIEAHDGAIVKSTGDGVHAVFRTAHDAVCAALDAQEALSVQEWGVTGALRVRLGVHTGECELRGGDYYGSVVNRAPRKSLHFSASHHAPSSSICASSATPV
jgi:class 3 adenylate cyclase